MYATISEESNCMDHTFAACLGVFFPFFFYGTSSWTLSAMLLKKLVSMKGWFKTKITFDSCLSFFFHEHNWFQWRKWMDGQLVSGCLVGFQIPICSVLNTPLGGARKQICWPLCVPFSITDKDYASSTLNLRQPFSMLNKLGQVTSSDAKPQLWAVVINKKQALHTNRYLSKKTIYLLFRIYKAVAEVTECDSGSEKWQSGTQNWATQP